MKNIDFEIAEFVDATGEVLTMSSIAIVELINKLRDDDEGKLRHRDFMTKVPQVIGDFCAARLSASQNYNNNNTRGIYNFPKREACLMLMSYSYDIQAAVYDKLIEYESKLKNPVFALPTTYKEALIALVASEEVKERLALERDLAIKTKAHISDKKTATALQNSGAKTKVINKLTQKIDILENQIEILEDQLEAAPEFYSIKAVTNLGNSTTKYRWQDLKARSNAMGLPMPKIHDDQYGKVKTYHVDVWYAVYSVVL